ncbi:hypothetical protein [Peribacillus sp. SCS-37]|uniref:hypothetical protein n=1 Tax=Paraperibacillus esterisolvens TaxID=3115296 RepID=UPI003905FC6B
MRRITKQHVFFWSYLVLLLLLLTSPFWLWQLKGTKELDVLVVDKTVSDTSYREHKGLMWILNNGKYKKEDGQPYRLERDYRGYKPGENGKHRISTLPENLDSYDLIYLADQYGVYNDDVNSSKKGSGLLYGGLTRKEISKLESALSGSKKTLIAEFNTFASPADDEVKQRMESLLGIKWQGWIGRYFSDLEGREVPEWARSSYKEQNGKQWNYTGEGFLFVNRTGRLVVLPKTSLTAKNGLSFTLTPKGRELAGKNLKARYGYWFDVIEPEPGTETLAQYEIPVKKKAENRLKSEGIPLKFPAILHQKNAGYNSYYFAGDFADEEEVPGIYQTTGTTALKRLTGQSFFWESYVPLMQGILEKGLHQTVRQQAAEIKTEKGVKFNTKSGKEFVQILRKGKWVDMPVKGVNMGISKPGYFPGETAITKGEYLRWFKQIGRMNANTIRVYTLHPPAFYQAFYEYNKQAEKPLYLLHGVWIEEEKLVKTQNMFSGGQSSVFKENIRQITDAVHGQAKLGERAGHASGNYKWDISPYVLGFILGIEWDPQAVYHTNQKNEGRKPYKGMYFSSGEGASPFESWLAGMMDYTAAYEKEKYGWQHSISFTNWVTTDLLSHPSEPSVNEDLVSVNPGHIKKETAFKAGMFASYHIYPYYPDFLNYENRYVQYRDQDGKKNNYEGYLRDLIKEHTMPVLVAEFGVPGSRGMTHRSAGGMNQGNHSEEEQGRIDSRLYKSIRKTGYAGGLVFTWQDEWFKRTWNTMDADNPDRRPFWNNVQTNEQHFGLLSFDPGKEGASIAVDGSDRDWASAGGKAADFKPADDEIESVMVSADEGYVYIKAAFKKPLDFNNEDVYIMFDTIGGQGKQTVKLPHASVRTQKGVDFLAEIKSKDSARLMVDSYYDTFYYQYGEQLGLIPKAAYAADKDNDVFHPIRLALNKPLVIPDKKQEVPFQDYETGKLTFGNGDPSAKDYNSLTDIALSKNQTLMEMRIPWALLNVKDPSTGEIMGNMWAKGMEASVTIPEFNLALMTDKKGRSGMKKELAFTGVKWKKWDTPSYHERLKQSYYIMKKAYSGK